MMNDRIAVLPAVSLEAAQNPLAAEFIEIKSQKPSAGADRTPQAAPADKTPQTPQVDVGDKLFNRILSVKPNEVGEGFRDAQAAAKTFMTVADKTQALEKGAPAFEAAIAKSDSEYIGAIAKYSPEYLAKRHTVGEAQTKMVMTMQGFEATVGRLPEDKKETVGHLIALAQDDNVSPAMKAGLRKELDKYPGVLKAFDAADASIKVVETAQQAMEKAAQPLMQAAYEQAATRYIYAHAMELGGAGGRAVIMKQEGKSKIDDAANEYLDAPKPPSHIQQA